MVPLALAALAVLAVGAIAVRRRRRMALAAISGSGPLQPHVVLAATHDGELGDLLRDTYSVFHFGGDVGPDGLVFDHKLRPGPATTRNAIALLQLHGASADLIRRAVECAAILDARRGTTVHGR